MAMLTWSHCSPNNLGGEKVNSHAPFWAVLRYMLPYIPLRSHQLQETDLTHQNCRTSYQMILQKACVISAGALFATMHIPIKRAQATARVLTAMMSVFQSSHRSVWLVLQERVFIGDCVRRSNLEAAGRSCGRVEKRFAWHFNRGQHGWGPTQQPDLRMYKCPK